MQITIETVVYILSGLCTIGFSLLAAIYRLHREEIKNHTEELKTKADNDKMTDIELRLVRDIDRLKTDNEKLISRIEQRHDRELEQMETRLGAKMEKLETNIMAQMNIIMQLLQKKSS